MGQMRLVSELIILPIKVWRNPTESNQECHFGGKFQDDITSLKMGNKKDWRQFLLVKEFHKVSWAMGIRVLLYQSISTTLTYSDWDSDKSGSYSLVTLYSSTTYLALQRVVMLRIVCPLRPMIAPTYSLGTMILNTRYNSSVHYHHRILNNNTIQYNTAQPPTMIMMDNTNYQYYRASADLQR